MKEPNFNPKIMTIEFIDKEISRLKMLEKKTLKSSSKPGPSFHVRIISKQNLQIVSKSSIPMLIGLGTPGFAKKSTIEGPEKWLWEIEMKNGCKFKIKKSEIWDLFKITEAC